MKHPVYENTFAYSFSFGGKSPKKGELWNRYFFKSSVYVVLVHLPLPIRVSLLVKYFKRSLRRQSGDFTPSRGRFSSAISFSYIQRTWRFAQITIDVLYLVPKYASVRASHTTRTKVQPKNDVFATNSENLPLVLPIPHPSLRFGLFYTGVDNLYRKLSAFHGVIIFHIPRYRPLFGKCGPLVRIMFFQT